MTKLLKTYILLISIAVIALASSATAQGGPYPYPVPTYPVPTYPVPMPAPMPLPYPPGRVSVPMPGPRPMPMPMPMPGPGRMPMPGPSRIPVPTPGPYGGPVATPPGRTGNYQYDEWQKYLEALPRVPSEFNPTNPNSRIGRVYDQLVQDTGKQFRVFPAQTGNIGQAHAGGLILIDISKLSEPTSVLAFWLAHEWAHLELGHQPNIYRPQGTAQWQVVPTQREDQADIWAARFLARQGYPVEQVVQHLRQLPHSPYDHSHSEGWVRAQNVQNAYSQVGGMGYNHH